MPGKNGNAPQQRRLRAVQGMPDTSHDQAEQVRIDAADKLWSALRSHPGSTTAELSVLAGIGRSTAGKILASWNADGTVSRISGFSEGGRRAPDRWTVLDSDDTSADTPASEKIPAEWLDADDEPTGTAAGPENHDSTEHYREVSTVDARLSDPLAVPEATPSTDPSGDRDAPRDPADDALDMDVSADSAGGSGGDADTDAPPTVDIQNAESSEVADADPLSDVPEDTQDPSAAGKPRRLASGELHRMVEQFLRQHVGEEFGPSAIGKALGHSNGAVANALVRLTERGVAVQTCDRPRRYSVAPEE
jgi:hypothetical protein